MLRRLGRPLAGLFLLLLLIPSLVACGSSSEKDSKSSSATFGAVSLSGDVGKSVKASWEKSVGQPKSTTVKTLVKGSGEKIAKGDSVSTYLWVANGSSKKKVYSDYDNGAAETIPYNDQLNAFFTQLLEDARYGSRVVALTNSQELFGPQGGTQLGVAADDSVVVVADFVEKAAVSPNPTDDKVHDAPAKSQPKVVETKGKPTTLDWAGIDKPALTTPVQRVVLEEGKGAKVKGSDTVTVRYLGLTYQAKTAFDENYSKTVMTRSLAELVPGWKIGLAGVKVGSRVLLQIPPAFAYGAQGSGEDIPPNSTLWFVIDVIKTK